MGSKYGPLEITIETRLEIGQDNFEQPTKKTLSSEATVTQPNTTLQFVALQSTSNDSLLRRSMTHHVKLFVHEL